MLKRRLAWHHVAAALTVAALLLGTAWWLRAPAATPGGFTPEQRAELENKGCNVGYDTASCWTRSTPGPDDLSAEEAWNRVNEQFSTP